MGADSYVVEIKSLEGSNGTVWEKNTQKIIGGWGGEGRQAKSVLS